MKPSTGSECCEKCYQNFIDEGDAVRVLNPARCSNPSCSCHTGSESWENEFDDIVYNTKYSEYAADGRFCCGGDYCEVGHNKWIKNFIRETIAIEVAKAKKCIRKDILSNFRRIEYMANDTSASGIREERMLWLNEYLMTLE